MVLLEALSVGLPIVSFDCPNGPRNIITNKEDGLLVENQNVKDLAEKILVLIQKEDKRISFGLAAKVNSEKFATTVVMQRWKNLLNS
jgi:glycosyltransferase involved in cell wall biosynthesis